MAEISATTPTMKHKRAVLFKWSNITTGDTAGAVFVGHLTDFTCQVKVNSGSPTVTWQATLNEDGDADFIDITDALSGSIISQTADALDEILQQGLWVKPVLAGTADVTCWLLGRRLLSG